jgi:asparagine synthase (glutamine-hydrolysing)
MSSGFSIIAQRGEIRLFRHNLEGDRAAAMIDIAEADGLRAVVFGRLYYRGDLAAALGPDAPQTQGDAALALACYRKFGAAGLERLEGEYAVAVIDAGARRIIAGRDPMGAYPIYWTKKGGDFALATCLRPLARFRGETTVDTDFLGEKLMIGFSSLDYRESTAFRDIKRLVTGATLIANVQSGSVEVVKHWDWQARMKDPGTDNVDIVAEEYRVLLDRAVRERLRGTVAAHFSGGMDSTAVALLAERHLASANKPVHALSITYSKLFGLKDETPYIEAALADSSLVSHRLSGDAIADFDDPNPLRLYDEPSTGIYQAGRDIALTTATADIGADTALTGVGADELVADAPYYLADLVRSGRVMQAWEEATRWGRANSSNPMRTLRPFGIEPLLPATFQAGLRAALSGGFVPFSQQSPWTIPPWVKRDFAKRARLRPIALDALRGAFRGASSVALSYALAAIRNTAGDIMRNHFAAPRGVHIAHPFRDPRLMEYALGARLRIRPKPGEQKVLIGRATRDLLPEMITKRREKVSFNAAFFQGLNKNLPILERMIEDSPVEEMGLFDKKELVTCMRRAALAVDKVRGINGLNHSLAMTRWLYTLPRWREAVDTTTELFTAPAQRAGQAPL